MKKMTLTARRKIRREFVNSIILAWTIWKKSKSLEEVSTSLENPTSLENNNIGHEIILDDMNKANV